MMDVLNFVFSSFWKFVGMWLLISAIGGGIISLFRAIFVRTSFDLIEPKIRRTIVEAIKEAERQ